MNKFMRAAAVLFPAFLICASAVHADPAVVAQNSAPASKAMDSTFFTNLTSTGQSQDAQNTSGRAALQPEIVSPPNVGLFDAAAKQEAIQKYGPLGFLDVYYGRVSTDDSSVSATWVDVCFIFCFAPAQQTVSRRVQFDRSETFGLRVGSWFTRYPNFGLAADFAYLQARAPGVNIWYMPISFVMMGRYGLLKTDSVPVGRLQIYGGLMLSEVIGDIEVNFTPEMNRSMGGSVWDINIGAGAFVGLTWHFPSFAIFSEYRVMSTSLDYDTSDNDYNFGASEKVSADLDTKQILFGTSFKF